MRLTYLIRQTDKEVDDLRRHTRLHRDRVLQGRVPGRLGGTPRRARRRGGHSEKHQMKNYDNEISSEMHFTIFTQINQSDGYQMSKMCASGVSSLLVPHHGEEVAPSAITQEYMPMCSVSPDIL